MAYRVPITIASGVVSATLTNYPVMVRLSGMPAAFWTHARSDGGDIRVKTSTGALVPIDLVRFDVDSKDGVLFFKAASVPTGSNSSWDIHYGNAALTKLAVTDTNGRNNVWSAYTAVFLFGETAGDDRTGGAMASIEGDPDLFELIETSSGDLNSHQGVCWDGTYYYTVDTNALYKWNSVWTLIATNADPIGAANIGGSPTVNHCGDPDVKNGRLYVPIECYPASGGLYNAHIAVFNPVDLSFIESFDISAQAHETSSIAFCDKDSLLYITDYDANTTSLFKYDPTSGAARGTLTTDKAIPSRQGVTWWRDNFWVSQDANDETLRVSYTGVVSVGNLSGGSGGIGFGSDTAADYEGIGHTTESLLQVIDPGATERVEKWKPRNDTLCAGGGVNRPSVPAGGSGLIIANGRTALTTYTLACSLAIASKGQNRTVVSYVEEAATGASNTRQVIAYRNSSTTLAIWDVNNSWLEPSPIVNPTLDQFYRMHAVYNGTTFRKIYVNGSLKNTQNGILAVPSTLNTLRIFSEDTDNLEIWLGNAGFIYLYPGVLSTDWIAAEYTNLNTPASFYTLGAEVVVLTEGTEGWVSPVGIPNTLVAPLQVQPVRVIPGGLQS